MKARGFTLVEMLVVTALLGVLAATARPLLELQVQRSKELALRDALRQLRGAIDAHRQAAWAGHLAVPRGGSGYPEDLLALVRGVTDLRSGDERKLYFLRRLPRDPFADPALAPEQTWVLRGSADAPGTARPGRQPTDVFDVSSANPARALDGSRLADW